MNKKERFHATLGRKAVDYPASWLGLPVPDACPGLFQYFGVDSIDALKQRLNDDVHPIAVPFNKPPANHVQYGRPAEQSDGL